MMQVSRTLQKIRRRWAIKPQTIECIPAPGFGKEALKEIRSILASSYFESVKFQPRIEQKLDGKILIESLDLRLIPDLVYRVSCCRHLYLKICDGHVGSYGEFADRIEKINWREILPASYHLKLSVNSVQSKLYHESRLCSMARAVLERQSVELREQTDLCNTEMSPLVVIRFEQYRNRLVGWISLNGEPLYKRGYRTISADTPKVKAPLAEHIAASLFQWYGSFSDLLSQSHLIYVPFAGGGSLGFEYASWRRKRAPFGFRRRFSFESMPFFPEATAGYVKKKLKDLNQTHQLESVNEDSDFFELIMLERDQECFLALCDNTNAFQQVHPGLSISPMQGDFFHVHPCDPFSRKSPNLSVFLNPPYGLRLPHKSASAFYRRIGESLCAFQKDFACVHGFVLLASDEAFNGFRAGIGMKAIGPVKSFNQGGQHVRAVSFLLDESL